MPGPCSLAKTVNDNDRPPISNSTRPGAACHSRHCSWKVAESELVRVISVLLSRTSRG